MGGVQNLPEHASENGVSRGGSDPACGSQSAESREETELTYREQLTTRCNTITKCPRKSEQEGGISVNSRPRDDLKPVSN